MLDLYDCEVQQLIQAPTGMYEVGTDGGEEYRLPIVAFALIRGERGNQRVIPLSMDNFGDVDSASGCRIVWDEVEDGEV